MVDCHGVVPGAEDAEDVGGKTIGPVASGCGENIEADACGGVEIPGFDSVAPGVKSQRFVEGTAGSVKKVVPECG